MRPSTCLGMLSILLLCCGCADVRFQSTSVEYLKKPLRPLPDVQTYSVKIDPPSLASPNELQIEGKRLVREGGDMTVNLSVGQPEVSRIQQGSDVYRETKNVKYPDGSVQTVVVREIPVYYLDVEVATNGRFSLVKGDGTPIQSDDFSDSRSFVFGKAPGKLLGGLVTVWTNGDWITDPALLQVMWTAQRQDRITSVGRDLQRGALFRGKAMIEHYYASGMRTASVPFGFFVDETADPRLDQGYRQALDAINLVKAGKAAEAQTAFEAAVATWTQVTADQRLNADKEPLVVGRQKALAHLNIAALAYCREDFPTASKHLQLATQENASDPEGFWAKIFKDATKQTESSIGQLHSMVADRVERERINQATSTKVVQ